MSFRLSSVLSISIAFGGCAQLDEMNSRALERREAARKTQESSSPSGKVEMCQKFDFIAPKDVDTAYAIAMRNFGFRTVEERKQAARANSYGYIDDGFKHAATPGAYYRMSDWTRVVGYGGSTWTNMELAKIGAAQTAVKGDFCYWEAAPGVDRRSTLLSSMKSAF
jgi:hypothetical protein